MNDLENGVLRGLPRWARGTINWFGGAAALTIQLGSSWSLGSLAYQAGFGWPRLLLLPIALDLGAVVSATLWVAGRGRNRATGRAVTLGLVSASAFFNAADVVTSLLTPKQMLAISVVIAVLFPLVAALMGHIVLQVRETETEAADQRERARQRDEQIRRERREEQDRAAAEAKGSASEPVDSVAWGSKRQVLKAFIREQWDAGVEKSAAAFERECFGSAKDTSYGRKVIAELRAEGVVPPSEREGGRPKLKLAQS